MNIPRPVSFVGDDSFRSGAPKIASSELFIHRSRFIRPRSTVNPLGTGLAASIYRLNTLDDLKDLPNIRLILHFCATGSSRTRGSAVVGA